MNGKMRKRTGPAGRIVVALIASALIVGALHPTYCQTPEGYVYRAPEQTADSLETGSLADAGIDIASVEAMMNALLTDKIDNIHSVLLIKDGKLVLEEYFEGFDRETLHSIQSDTKSVSSILIGIATDRVLFTDLDRKIASFFPNYENVMKPAWKDKITLRHCLTMTAGIEWNEWGVPYEDPKNEYASLNNRLDLFDYIFQKDLVDTPGTEFNYCGGQSLILGGVIQNTSNLYADQFAEMFLFKPLGIRKFDWWKHQDGAIRTDGGLHLRSRDMAKIGLLFLQNGRWKDRHILSERWVTESVKAHIKGDFIFGSGYGYQWWNGAAMVKNTPIHAFFAVGRGGQYIFVVPELACVAVFTSQVKYNKFGDFKPPALFTNYLLSAMIPGSPPQPAVENHIPAERCSGRYMMQRVPLPMLLSHENETLYFHGPPDGERIPLTFTSENSCEGFSALWGRFGFDFFVDKTGGVKNCRMAFGFGTAMLDKIEKQ